MNMNSSANQVGRRGELLAELFLQDLKPAFFLKSQASNFEFDFLIGFKNVNGGLNAFAIEVKATEKPIRGHFLIGSKPFDRLRHSNIPVILLLVDTKENNIYYTQLKDHSNPSRLSESVRVPVVLIDTAEKERFVKLMKG